MNPVALIEDQYKTTRWFIAAIVTFFLIPALALITVVTLVPVIAFVPLLLAGGIYTICVFISLVGSWRRYIATGLSEESVIIKNFGLFRQRATLLINILLALAVAFALINFLIYVEPDNISLGFPETTLYVTGSVAGVAGWFSIVINSKWIFSDAIRFNEWEALKTKTGKWKLIAFNLIFSACIWIMGSLIGVLFVIKQSF